MPVLFAVGAEVTRADIPCLCADLAELLRGSPGEVVTCDVSAVKQPDVVLVEALAKLRLTAGRHGWRLEVHGAPPELQTLFTLMGLGGFFSARFAATRAAAPQSAGEGAGADRSEPRREAEEREQPVGVEEVVDPGDLAV